MPVHFGSEFSIAIITSLLLKVCLPEHLASWSVAGLSQSMSFALPVRSIFRALQKPWHLSIVMTDWSRWVV